MFRTLNTHSGGFCVVFFFKERQRKRDRQTDRDRQRQTDREKPFSVQESYFSCALNGRTNLSAYIDLLNGTSPGSSSCVRSGTDGRPDSPAGQTSTSFSGGGSDCYLSPTQTATSSNAYGSFTITAWIWINQTGFAYVFLFVCLFVFEF